MLAVSRSSRVCHNPETMSFVKGHVWRTFIYHIMNMKHGSLIESMESNTFSFMLEAKLQKSPATYALHLPYLRQHCSFQHKLHHTPTIAHLRQTDFNWRSTPLLQVSIRAPSCGQVKKQRHTMQENPKEQARYIQYEWYVFSYHSHRRDTFNGD